ncbi:uncharacterized protein Sap-r isoform X2 [Centruroides vittatus]|uniref:uncharacterized protein Sap-r isoform X2 n=1 Tax=Centruroides vittatus TaxID=120091 RepID=UPI00350FA0DF
MKSPVLVWLFCVASFALAQKPPTACIDPTFACQDLRSAKLCGTVKDCITDIWSTLSAPEDNNEICDLCKQMVQEARDQLLSNETQEEIKEVFEGSCALIPIKIIADECKKLVDEFIPELIEMLASRMDPNMVCTVAGLCNGEISKELSSADIVSLFYKSKYNYCSDCKKVFNAVKEIFTKVPQDEMQDMLLKICNQLSESKQCTTMVRSFLPIAYDFVTSMNAADVCSMIGECSEVSDKITKYQDNMTCEFCEAMVQHLRDLILTNTTKEEFKTALLNLCSLFKNFASECKELVNDYFDMLYDLLDQVLNPQTLCTYLGLCSSSKIEAKIIITPLIKMWNGKHAERVQPSTQSGPVTSLRNSIPAVKILPNYITHENKYNKKESNDIKSIINQLPIERLGHPILYFKQDTECGFCKAVMFFLSKDINQRNEKIIEDSLDKVCTKWIPSYSKECKSFVDSYNKKVVELLLLGVKFEEVCDHLNTCRPEEKILATKILPPTESKNDFRCEICENVMTYLEDRLKDKTTEQEIRAALDKACTILPASMWSKCQSFVDKYTDTIVSLIIQDVKPSAICITLGLCSKNFKNPIKSQITCELCQDVMTYLKQVLKDPKTEDEIKQALDEVCSVLPQSLTQQCEDFVNQYTDLIISLLLQEFDPDEICAKLGLCPKNESLQNVENTNIECTLCKDIMEALETKLKDKSTEDEIRAALDTVCSLLPGTYAKKCQEFIDKYTETIVTLLVQNIKPRMICSLLNICPSENLECTLCQYFLHFLQERLMSNSTEWEIKNLAEKVCSYLPESLSSECRAFVDEYGDAMVVLLAQEIDPSVVCPLFKLCPSVGRQAKTELDTCDVCRAVVDYLDGLLEDNGVDREISDLASRVCRLLPASSRQECVSIVELYGPTILKTIGTLADGRRVCQSVDLCPRAPGAAHLLGAEKCTFGPDYWCKSPAHAAACQAEEFCRRKVWKN